MNWKLFCALSLFALVAGFFLFGSTRSAPEKGVAKKQRNTSEETLITSSPASLPSPKIVSPVSSLPNAVMDISPPLPAMLQTASLVQQGESVVQGRVVRKGLYKADGKYPLVLVEEVVEKSSTGQEQFVRRDVMVGNHMMVRFPSGMTAADAEQWAADHGYLVLKKLRTTDVYLIQTPETGVDALDHIIDDFKCSFPSCDQISNVSAERDFLVFSGDIPNDPSFGMLWGLQNTGQSGGTADADIDAPEAWEIAIGSRDVVIGIIDSGIDRTHPDLAANMWTNPGEIAENGIDDDGNGFVDDVHGWDFYADDNNPHDENGHGTHCAGTIGAVGGNGIGVAGVNWEVSMVALRFLDALGSGYSSDAIDAVNYARTLGLDLTSNSWGGGGYSSVLEAAIRAAGDVGMFFIAAAGNDNVNNDVSPYYPSSYDLDCIIAVASSDRNDSRSSFSCYGLISVDLAAPGTDIYSTVPNGSYGIKSGTSMATPHVAGAVALIKSVAPMMTIPDLKSLLLDHVDPLPAFNGKCVSGGRLNLSTSLEYVAGALPSISSVMIDDRAGNGDGIVNPGEIFEIALEIENRGVDPATNLVATLRVDTGSMFDLQIASVPVGDLASGQTIVPSNVFSVVAVPSAFTPYLEDAVVEFTFTSVGGADVHEVVLPLSIYISSAVSGRVTDVSGSPIEGAMVGYDGTTRGQVATDSNGGYSVILIDGSYSFQASAMGYVDGVAQSVVVPPGKGHVDFSLGNPEILVSPTNLQALVFQSNATIRVLDIHNSGDVPLIWSVGRVFQTLDQVQLVATSVASDFEEGMNPVQAVEVLALETALENLDGIKVGSLSSWSYTTIFADIAQRGGTVVSLAFPLGSNDLAEINVLVIDDLVAGAAANDVSLIREWVYSGGGLLLQGDNSSSVSRINTILVGSGISEYHVGFSDRTLTNFEPHPITEDVSELYPSAAGLFCTLDGDAAPLVRDASGNVFAAVSAYGSGRVVAAGNEILAPQDLTGDGRLFANQVVDWLASHVAWLSVLPTSGMVSTGTTEMVDVSLESSGLDEGIYAAQITFVSNDPDQPESTVSVEMEVVGPPVLSVMLPTAVTEDSGVLPVGGQIYLSRPSTSNTVVDLISDDLSELIVSSNVTIQAGQTNVSFAITVVDDGLLDGSAIVTVSASAEDHVSGAASVFVYDNETATLSLSLPSITSEGVGHVGGAVMIDQISSEDVVVTLLTDDPSEVAATNVVVSAGMNIALFDMGVVDDDLVDGVRAVIITAHVENWTDGVASIFVHDNESTSLSLDLPSSAAEGDGLLANAGMVSVAGVMTTNMLISLACSDTSEATVPTSVIILQGQSNVIFDIMVMDDSETDGLQNLSIVGVSSGFVPCVDTMSIADDDVHHFTFSEADAQQTVGTPFNIGIIAETIDNQTINSFTGMVSLSASGDIGFVAMTPVESSAFSGGQWSGDVTVMDISDNVVLVADDGAGFSGTSTAFNVVGSRIIITPASLTNTLVVAGQSAVRTMVISNAGNADLEFVIHGADVEKDTSLILHYTFDDDSGTTVIDQSGNENHGVLMNNCIYTNGVYGKGLKVHGNSYDFSSAGGHVLLPEIDFNAMDEVTVALWVNERVKHHPHGTAFIGFGVSGGTTVNSGQVCIGDLSDGLSYRCGTDRTTGVYSPDLNRFVHYALSYSGGSMRAYRDGILLEEIPASLYVRKSELAALGRHWWDDGASTCTRLTAVYDDVRIYDRALSAEEILELYNLPAATGSFGDNPTGSSDNEASAGSAILFSDDFEDGDFDGWSGETWMASVVDDVVAEGSFSLLIDSGKNSHYSGLLQEFDGLQPERISFFWRSEDPETGSGHTVFGGDDADSTQGQVIFFYALWGDLRCIGAPHVACNAGQWYYIEFHLDWKSKQFDYFIDDELIASDVPFRATTVDKISKAYLYNMGTDTGRHWWDGFVFSSGSTNDGLIAHYPFNGNADDESGNGHDGTVNGAQLTVDRFGNPNRAYLFDGANDYIDLEILGGFKSVSIWVRQDVRSEYDYYFGHDDFRLFASDPETGRLALHDGSFNPSVKSSIWMDDHVGEWIHVVAVSDGVNSKIYVNGDDVTADPSDLHSVSSAIVNLGRWPGVKHYFNGKMDDVRVYDRALSEAEIQELYNEDNPNDSWWSASPISGTVSPGTSVVVSVEFDAEGLVAGDYLSDIMKTICNDALSPTNGVPVSMHVLPSAPVMFPGSEFTAGTSNEVSWSSVGGPVDYLVEVTVDTNAAPQQKSGWIAPTSHTFGGLNTNVVYYYHARASVTSGVGRLEGPWSEWVHSTQVSDNGDLDGDGLPNWWETKHFGGVTNAVPSRDSDGDGQKNWEEFISGMDPADPDSYFMITRHENLPVGYIIRWDAISNRVYGVYWASNMMSLFQSLKTNIYYPQNSYTDSVHHAQPCGFYQIDIKLNE